MTESEARKMREVVVALESDRDDLWDKWRAAEAKAAELQGGLDFWQARAEVLQQSIREARTCQLCGKHRGLNHAACEDREQAFADTVMNAMGVLL